MYMMCAETISPHPLNDYNYVFLYKTPKSLFRRFFRDPLALSLPLVLAGLLAGHSCSLPDCCDERVSFSLPV